MALGSAWKIIGGLFAFGLVACNSDLEPPPEYRTEQTDRIRDQHGTIHGESALFQRGTGSFKEEDKSANGAGAIIGVNAYLWRAALDTISFLPLTQADPFGGVIITDWHSPAETPDQRFKLNVYILDSVLRADGVKVSVFRQVDGDGGWRDAEVSPQVATDLEDNILTRARELRIAALDANG